MKSVTCNLYQFGPFCLDTVERVLLRDGRLVPLPAKAISTLLVLVRNSKHLVEKDVLMNEVWPDEVVEESNLAQHIFMLRKALGETESCKYIETIPRRGYRLLVTVSETNGQPTRDSRIGIDSQVRPSHSLAVLPLVNATEDQKLERVADSLTESLINRLSRDSELYVAARNSVLRYQGREVDARQAGRELGVRNVLLGGVHFVKEAIEIRIELVNVDGGWQLYGKNYEVKDNAPLEMQEEIANEILAALRKRSSQGLEQVIGKRHTENSEAYESYLRGRFYWSKYTTAGLEEAIRWFRKTIDLDPGFALAYAATIDCYLRLATGYLPPADDAPKTTAEFATLEFQDGLPQARATLELRREWDWKAAERECMRAIELKANYPAAHQWYSAYMFARRLYEERAQTNRSTAPDPLRNEPTPAFDAKLLDNIQSSRPTPAEEVQVFCIVAREQIEAGNYEAALAVLQRWWKLGEWPQLDHLSPHSSADLLFTVGSLAGNVVSTRQVPRGQKHAEALLNGSIALFEQVMAKKRAAEGRIELGLCYQREGLFDLSRAALLAALSELSDRDLDLKSLGLIRLASLERTAGCLQDGQRRLNEAADIVELGGPWVTGRYLLELASSLKDLALAENRTEPFDRALEHYTEALYEFTAVGHHRLAAIVENNYGYLLLTQDQLDAARPHLIRSRKLFDGFGDKVRCAQVDETMAQLHLAAGEIQLAEQVIIRSVETLDQGGEDPVLAESLRTQGVVLCRLGRYREAQRVLERAQQVSEHCDDTDGAERARVIKLEVIDQLSLELKRSEQRLLALEMDATERRVVKDLALEMRETLADSKSMLDQVLGLNGSPQTMGQRKQTTSAREEKLVAILKSLKEATARGLEITEQLIEHSKQDGNPGNRQLSVQKVRVAPKRSS